MKLLYVLCIVMMVCSVMMQAAAQCVCTANYNPVCGVNGHTYPNKCRLNCDKVKQAHTGKC